MVFSQTYCRASEKTSGRSSRGKMLMCIAVMFAFVRLKYEYKYEYLARQRFPFDKRELMCASV